MLLAPIVLAVRGLVVFLQYNFYAAAYMNLKSVRQGKDNTDGIEETKLLKFGELSHMSLFLLAAFYIAPAYAVLSLFVVGFGITLLYAWPYLNKVVAPYLKSIWNMLMIKTLTKWPSLKKLLLPLIIKSKPTSGEKATLSRFARLQRIYLKFIIPVFTYLPLLVMVAAIYFNAPLFFFAALAGLFLTYLERTNKLPSKIIDIKETIFSWIKLPLMLYRWVLLDIFSKIVQGVILIFSTLSSWSQAVQKLRRPKEKDYAVLYSPKYLTETKTQADNLDRAEQFEDAPDSEEKTVAETATENAKQFFIRTFLLISDRDLKEYIFTTRSHFLHTMDVGVDPKAKVDLKMTETAAKILFSQADIPYEQYLLHLQESDTFQSFCIEQAALPHQPKNPDKANLFPKQIGEHACDKATAQQLYDYLEKNPTVARPLIDRFVKSLQKTLVNIVKHNSFNNLKREGVLKIKKAIQNTLEKIQALQPDSPQADVEELRRFYIVGILAEMTKCTNNGVIMAEHILGTPQLTPEQKLTHCLNERRNINFDSIMNKFVTLQASVGTVVIASEKGIPSQRSSDPALQKVYDQLAEEKAKFTEASLKILFRGYDNNHDRAYWRHLFGPVLGLHHALTEYDLVEKDDSFGPAFFEFFNFLLTLDEIAPNLYKYLFYDLPEIKEQFNLQELSEYLRAHYTKVLTLAKCDAQKIPGRVDQILLAIFEEFATQNLSVEQQIRKIVTFMAVQEGFVYWDIEKRKHPRWDYFKSYFGVDKPLRSVITLDEAPPVTSLKDLLATRISHFPKRKKINHYLEKAEKFDRTIESQHIKNSRYSLKVST